MDSQENTNSERVDIAVSARLRKLSTFPVDVSRLERQLQREIPKPQLPERRPLVMRLMRPVTAVAASMTIAVVVAAALLTSSSGEAFASPAPMAQVHRDIVENRMPVTKVDSIEAASGVLAGQWPGKPELPAAPDAHVMACCMKSIKDKKVACVLLKSEGAPITMSVANASDMRAPAGVKAVTRSGATYHLVSSDGLNMVMTERNGRWVCLISEVASDRLIAVAEKLEF